MENLPTQFYMPLAAEPECLRWPANSQECPSSFQPPSHPSARTFVKEVPAPYPDNFTPALPAMWTKV